MINITKEKVKVPYPVMQNPGVPGVFDKKQEPKVHVLIMTSAELIDPNKYDRKVLLYNNGDEPSEELEVKALKEIDESIRFGG